MLVQNHSQMLVILILVFLNVTVTISYIHKCNCLPADLTSVHIMRSRLLRARACAVTFNPSFVRSVIAEWILMLIKHVIAIL